METLNVAIIRRCNFIPVFLQHLTYNKYNNSLFEPGGQCIINLHTYGYTSMNRVTLNLYEPSTTLKFDDNRIIHAYIVIYDTSLHSSFQESIRDINSILINKGVGIPIVWIGASRRYFSVITGDDINKFLSNIASVYHRNESVIHFNFSEKYVCKDKLNKCVSHITKKVGCNLRVTMSRLTHTSYDTDSDSD